VLYACNLSVVKCEWKKSLENLGCRWEDNIKIDLKEIGCRDRVQWWDLKNTVLNNQVP
jgi:hypothetical protein